MEASREMTISEFESLMDTAFEKKEEIRKISEEKKAKEGELSEMSRVILAEFTRLDKTSYKTRWGNVVRTQKYSVSLPKEDGEKSELFGYLKDKGIFDTLVTINYQTLNSFYSQERDAAKEEGRYDFKIPGLAAPKVHEYLSFKK